MGSVIPFPTCRKPLKTHVVRREGEPVVSARVVILPVVRISRAVPDRARELDRPLTPRKTV